MVTQYLGVFELRGEKKLKQMPGGITNCLALTLIARILEGSTSS